jgi:type II secretion system protein N
VQIKPIRPGDPPLHGGVTIPALRLGKLGCRIVIAGGRATFKDCKTRSDDLELMLSGSISLRDPFRFSTMVGYLKFRFTDDVKRREPKWLAFEAALAKGRRGDGFFGFSIRGRLSELRVRPSRQ